MFKQLGNDVSHRAILLNILKPFFRVHVLIQIHDETTSMFRRIRTDLGTLISESVMQAIRLQTIKQEKRFVGSQNS